MRDETTDSPPEDYPVYEVASDHPVDEPIVALPARPRRARRIQLVGGLLALAVVLAVGGWWHFVRSNPEPITVGGAAVDAPTAVLASADARFHAYVSAQRGRTSGASHCSFARARPAAAGAASSDVQNALLCGPVLFYEGSPDRPYLSFPLRVHPEPGGHVQLAAAARPPSAQPAAAPRGVELVRPDGVTAPRLDAGFAAPAPPPAEVDVLQAVDTLGDTALPATPGNAAIGGSSTHIALLGAGPVSRFDAGPDERGAPVGQRLIAFELEFTAGANDFAPLSALHLGVSVDGGAPRPLALADAPSGVVGTDKDFVVGLSPTSGPVDLVLTEAGITQRLSLVSGQPAATNIALLRNPTLPSWLGLTVAQAQAVVTDHGASFPAQLDIQLTSAQLTSAQLGFFVAPGLSHPKSNGDAFLMSDLCYRSRDFVDPTSCLAFRASDVTVTPSGGRPIPGVEVRANDGQELMFEVPAGFRSGTLTIGGNESSGDGRSMRISPPVRIPISVS